MDLPEMRLLYSAVVLAEELNFTRAAKRLGIDQTTLTHRMSDLEAHLGFQLFERNHQVVELTAKGAQFIAGLRKGVTHIEDAMSLVTKAARDADEVLNIGRTAYTDPWLPSIVESIRLPLYPATRIRWWSHNSPDLAREVMEGRLDLALMTGIPETPKLTCLKVAEHPFYIAMSSRDPLAARRDLRLSDLDSRVWVLFAKHVSPYLYEAILREASKLGIGHAELHHVTSVDEAVPLILQHDGLAFLNRSGAWRIAIDGITMRPLAEPELMLVTKLATRANSNSRLVRDFVKATARKLDILRKPAQPQLGVSA
jgi:DNA-binding transcriptional LysR family regulator